MSDALSVNNADRIEQIAVEIETIQGVALLKVGERLCEARELFKYNRDEKGFTGWIDKRLSFGSSTAYKLMDVFAAFGRESFHKVETLPRSVLYALAAPSTPAPVREEAMRRAEAGEPVNLEVVADLKRQLLDAKQVAKDAKRDEKVQKDLARKASDDRMDMVRRVERLEYEKESLAREVEKLKEDNTLHVYSAEPAEPEELPALSTVRPAPKPVPRSSCLRTAAELAADRFGFDTAEFTALLREAGVHHLAAEIEAVVAGQHDFIGPASSGANAGAA